MIEPTDLLGTWTLERVVDDRLTGEQRSVKGTTTLEPAGDGRVRWREEGTMTWAGHAVPVQRTLYVDRVDGGWFVSFEDGRPFHPWAVARWVDHPCQPDHYRGLIEVPDGPVTRWSVEWQATGPAKDYVMRSVHSTGRISAAGATGLTPRHSRDD